MPGRRRLDRSPNEPRTGSSQMRTSDCLAIDTVVAQAVEADVREVGQAMVFGAHCDLCQQLTGGRVHHVNGAVVAARRPQLGAVRTELKHVRAAPPGMCHLDVDSRVAKSITENVPSSRLETYSDLVSRET